MKKKFLLSVLMCFMVVISAAVFFACSGFKFDKAEPNEEDYSLEISGFTKDDDTFSITLPNEKEQFTFNKKVTIPQNYTWGIYSDVECKDQIISNTITLNVGDNVCYLLIKEPNNAVCLYRINIYRLHLYNVSFIAYDSSVITTIEVEENSKVQPIAGSVRDGYKFVGWDYDFSEPIKSDTTIHEIWEAKYIVRHLKQNVNDDNYTIIESDTEAKTGAPGMLTAATAKSYEGFTPLAITQATIKSDETTVVDVYYSRNVYALTLINSNNTMGTIIDGTNGNYRYDKTLSVAVDNTTLQYCFKGWYNGDVLLSKEKTYEFDMPNKELTLTAKWAQLDGLENYDFTATKTKLEINSVIDNSIKEAIVPEGVTSIGWRAFWDCSSLESVSIPDSITSVDYGAFNGCAALIYNEYDNAYYLGNDNNPYVVLVKAKSTEITACTINNKTKIICREAFSRCTALGSITIPSSVRSIDERAFWGCESLGTLAILDGVTSIGNNAFYNCKVLKNITIPTSVTSIGEVVFEGCTSLESIIVDSLNTIYDSRNNANAIIETAKNTLIVGCKNSIIPTSVTSIGKRAFDGCTSLNSITIPNGVTSIDSEVFSNCSSLVSITISASVTSIGECAFEECSSLESIVVDPLNTIYDSRNNSNAIIKTATNKLIFGCKNTIIPTGVTSIGEKAFYNCNSLESITIPSGVTSIGKRAFCGCELLESITIPTSVTSIGERAFSNCRSLTSVTIPGSVTSIDSEVFSNCSSLESITIPASVTSIGESAFRNCSSLESITILDVITSIAENAFECCSSLTYNEYDNAYYLGNDENPYVVLVKAKSTDITSCVINDKTKGIVSQAFLFCESLESITIPSGVTSIGKRAFCGCELLESITIPTSVTSIGERAFSNCRSLTSVTIPGSVTSIDSEVFSNCSSLESITIPASVTSIGESAFRNCSSLESITILDVITSIAENAFECCSSLTYNEYDNAYYLGNDENPYVVLVKAKSTDITSCVINDKTKGIVSQAFLFCESLESITIPASVVSIGEYAFAYCASLGSITVDPLNTIYDSRNNSNAIIETATNRLIAGCNSSIIPNSVTSIESYAFCACVLLENITIPNGVINIGEGAFSFCTSLESVTISASVISIGDLAFSYCYELKTVIIYGDRVMNMGSDVFSTAWDEDDFCIYVPDDLYDDYYAIDAEYWQEFCAESNRIHRMSELS